ncbi:MAG: carbohydrate ABC transporter substrate-binding protein [Actinomycetaceae bacterium]|nr:carbohydrate ABC transporter substrate-binding protein [Actinomycetaceae bacterium]MDY5854715.1 carbohydrate ABC transporter substrate-binding protein [Arcanobacterium sp.]
MKRIAKVAAVLCAAALGLGACGSSPSAESPKPNQGGAATNKTIKVAAVETAYGTDGWKAVAKAFEEETGIKVELQTAKNLEDTLGSQMQSGSFPDVVHMALGREKGLTETMVKDKALTDLSDVLASKVPGEDVTVQEKLIPGILNSANTDPYGDGKMYLAPMFYTPCGLYYDANLLKSKGWEVPTTWDEMWALGDKAKAEGIYLFSYPTAGYFDAFFYAMLYQAGGEDFFKSATNWEEGVWDTPEAKQIFDVIAKIATYTDPVVPAQANATDFTKNQQLVLDDKAIFMPNGDWVVGEMADAPRAEGFQWGSIALPAFKAGGDRYSTTFFEQAWVPAKAANQAEAKQFVAFLYSDKAAEAFASTSSPAFQPIVNATKFMPEDKKAVYGIYENGAKAAVGAMNTNFQLEGTEWKDVFFKPIDSLVAGTMTQDQWVQGIKELNDKVRPLLNK